MLGLFLRGLPPGRIRLLELLLVFNIIVSGATGDISGNFLGHGNEMSAEKKKEMLLQEERKESNAEEFRRYLEQDEEEGQPPFPWDLMIYCLIIWAVTLWCFLYCTTCGKKARGIIPLNEDDQEAFEIASDLASQKSKMKSNFTDKDSQDMGSDFPGSDDTVSKESKKVGPNAPTEFVIGTKYKKPDIGEDENFKKAGISEKELAKVK